MRSIIDWDIKLNYRNGLVYLTSGADRYCGLEIELNLPLNFKQAEKIINTTVSDCKADRELISENLKITIYKREVSFRKMPSLSDPNKPVWRMFLTDEHGKHPEDPACDPIYRKQLSYGHELS